MTIASKIRCPILADNYTSYFQIMRIKRYADLTSHHECVGKKALLANSSVPTSIYKFLVQSIEKQYAMCYHLSLNQCLTLHPNCQ